MYKATKRLLELGADINMKNRKGETPLDWINVYGENARRIFNEVTGARERQGRETANE